MSLVKQALVFEFPTQRHMRHLSHRIPVLILHGESDSKVPITHSERIFWAASLARARRCLAGDAEKQDGDDGSCLVNPPLAFHCFASADHVSVCLQPSFVAVVQGFYDAADAFWNPSAIGPRSCLFQVSQECEAAEVIQHEQ